MFHHLLLVSLETVHCIVQYNIMHYNVQEPVSIKFCEGSNEGHPKARRSGSREAIVEAVERLFPERAFGSVGMRL
jgi:hypothetical protein